MTLPNNSQVSAKGKKGKRFGKGTTSDLASADKMVLEGRRPCQCEATKHELIGNCLSCGRIVCVQEGSGPCFTCSALVCTKAERENMLAETAEGKERMLASLGVSGKDKKGLRDIASSFEKAVAHKDKMLDYDRNASVRTKVIDDEMDYYSLGSQNWISSQKRMEMKEKVEDLHLKKHATDRKIVIDLIGAKAYTLDKPVIENFKEKVQQLEDESKLNSDYQQIDASTFIDKQKDLMKLNYVTQDKKSKSKNESSVSNQAARKLVLPWNQLKSQDSELMVMSDEAMCLSIRQPFASLLIAGIKKHEGRSWYTPFRGRLWIHASAKSPSPEEVERVQLFYHNRIDSPKFPTSYPLSVLLGCVTLEEVLPYDEYIIKYPTGECGQDKYVFICSNPMLLQKPYRMMGHQKLFMLEHKVHQAVHKSLKQID